MPIPGKPKAFLKTQICLSGVNQRFVHFVPSARSQQQNQNPILFRPVLSYTYDTSCLATKLSLYGVAVPQLRIYSVFTQPLRKVSLQTELSRNFSIHLFFRILVSFFYCRKDQCHHIYFSYGEAPPESAFFFTLPVVYEN